jgi:hypothetical protein
VTEIEPPGSVPNDPPPNESEPNQPVPGAASPTTPGPSPTLPPDPAAYDSPRAVRAREKGLKAPYIAGGDDPDPAAGLAEDRRYVPLLVGMAIAIIASGFVIGTVIALIGPAGGR